MSQNIDQTPLLHSGKSSDRFSTNKIINLKAQYTIYLLRNQILRKFVYLKNQRFTLDIIQLFRWVAHCFRIHRIRYSDLLYRVYWP